MSKINDLFVAEAEKYISALMAEKLPETFIYHHFEHALRIRKYAETIGKESGLSDDDMNLLRFCALFRDSGYVSSYDDHYEQSVAIASAYLTDNGIEQPVIDHVSEIIRATRPPQEPRDKIAEVLCDAVMMYIASEDGLDQLDLLYDETVLLKPNFKRKSAFERGFIEFFTAHTYFTEYGKTILQPRKEAAIQRLSEKMKWRKLVENKKEAQEKGPVAYSRSVETMFRVAARNQINLNSIADNKSNILISVNAIIISIIITVLVGNIRNMSQDIIPILVLLLICLVTIIIAILSTRPIIINRKFTEEDLMNKSVDLIFFGNFIKMDFDEYLEAVKAMMKDEEHVYATLIKNQYSLGKILAKKFRLVKIAYNVFMFGLILTVVVFLVNLLVTSNAA